VDAGGAAGSSRGGQAGAAGGVPDAGTGRGDGSNDTVSADRDADTSRDTGADRADNVDRVDGADNVDSADDIDARADTSAPPSDAAGCASLPSAGMYATFRVVSDVFYVSITNPPGIDQAIALWRGQSQANIPVGQLECGNGTHNCGWTWRMNPASITFAEITIEVCDATPSYVQMNCSSFPNGQYCPWSAELIALRDCRTDPTCPSMPR
jgi:hypothetical protein